MEKVLVVYKTDAWHSYASRDIIGICTDKSKAIEICQRQARNENEKISDTELYNLSNISQTQGYSGEGEFQYEEVNINTLL